MDAPPLRTPGLPEGLRLLSETALDAVVIIGGDGEVLGWNKVAEQIFGWTAAEVVGRGMTDLIVPPQHRDGHRAGMSRYASTGEARVLNRRIEISALHKDGREFPVELSITTAPSDQGTLFVGFLRDITDRREAERALRDAQEEAAKLAAEQEAILSQLAEAVIVADAAGRLTFVNRAAARLHGVAKLGVAPEDYSETYHLLTEDGRPYPSAELPLARAVRGESVFEERWRISRPDGSEVLAVGSAQPLVGPDGARTGAVLTARDETERDRAEKRIRENEARLRALTDNLPGGAVYQISTGPGPEDRRFLFLSQSYERLSGVPVEKVLADPSLAYEAVHADDRPRLIEAEREAIEGRKPFDVQARFCRADGKVLWCRFISAPREQPDGSIVWDGIQIDATARITAELALRELNSTLEQRVSDLAAERDRIWRVSKDLFVVCGFDGFYRMANPAWEALLGHDPDSLVGTAFDALVHPDDAPLAHAGFERLVSGSVVDSLDLRVRSKSGAYRWISWTCVAEGEQFFASGRDVHERKLLEEQLRQSQKMEAVGQLTGGIAHDFNNLLTIIRSAVDLMRRRDLPEARRTRYVDAISDTVERASRLTSQLLAFARRQPLKPQVFEVGDQVRVISELIRPLLGSRMRVDLRLGEEPRYVEVDLSQFETALVNLSLNGRDAMGSEGTLVIELGEAAAIPALRGEAARPGDYVAIAVTDAGVGIAPEDIEQIFEPFFTTKEVGKGTGLGLSQVFGFVQQSGGNIEVTSAPGEGARFTLYLPRSSAAAPPEAPAEAKTAASPSTRYAHVLVVEDNEQVGQFSTETLHDLGYATTWVPNAEEALAALAGDDLRYDAVFTDVIMPGMNGLELAQAIRSRHPGLPVVLTSGYSDVLAKEGSYGFELLKKPYSVEALSRVLRRAIQKPAL